MCYNYYKITEVILSNFFVRGESLKCKSQLAPILISGDKDRSVNEFDSVAFRFTKQLQDLQTESKYSNLLKVTDLSKQSLQLMTYVVQVFIIWLLSVR